MASMGLNPNTSDKRKRALELLERRELRLVNTELKQPHKEEDMPKRIRKEDQKTPSSLPFSKHQKNEHRHGREDRAPSPVSHPFPDPQHKTSNTPRRKSFVERDGPVYSEICVPHQNLVQTICEGSTREEMVNKVFNDILKKGEGNKFAQRSDKLLTSNVVLLDNFVSKDEKSEELRVKSLMKHSKRSSKHMSMKQHRRCGSLEIQKNFHNFEHFKPMHDMWKTYIRELTKGIRKKQMVDCLMKADRHGAFMSVVECKTLAFKGVTGIMIRETAETFGIVSNDSRFRVVPKAGSVFIVVAGCWKITLIGDKLSPNEATKENRFRQCLQLLISK